MSQSHKVEVGHYYRRRIDSDIIVFVEEIRGDLVRGKCLDSKTSQRSDFIGSTNLLVPFPITSGEMMLIYRKVNDALRDFFGIPSDI
jgi:hypothetical protein